MIGTATNSLIQDNVKVNNSLMGTITNTLIQNNRNNNQQPTPK
jgi:hypothetical protein